jgi:flavin reductase (DIM6/NTAB) family NADH-FMN oxidoreductase RutF
MNFDTPFDSRAFRAALGCFPTGIAVMTASSSEASHIGITVNSFTSVSMDPPLVLWCIDRRSRRYPSFAEAPGFTVSILASGHKAVSSRLAGAGEHSLEGIDLTPTELGPPALAESLAVFECVLESVQEGSGRSRHPDRPCAEVCPPRWRWRAPGLFPGPLWRSGAGRAAGGNFGPPGYRRVRKLGFGDGKRRRADEFPF